MNQKVQNITWAIVCTVLIVSLTILSLIALSSKENTIHKLQIQLNECNPN